MKAITFMLSGKTAFFKKPDVNVNTYFTYNNIHKIALLGMLGAITGLSGYTGQNTNFNDKNNCQAAFPEFYEKLKELKISIEPCGYRGYFTKKIQVFNNTVGYASKEEGGNLVVREQWLENPSWRIYILEDNSIESSQFKKLKEYLLNKKCVYMLYLGKNDHAAEITGVEIIEIEEESEFGHIDTLFLYDKVKIGEGPFNEEDEAFFFREMSPLRLDREYNFYEFETLCYTNLEVEKTGSTQNIYRHKNKIVAFY